MLPSVRNRRLGMVSPRRGLGKQSRRIPSDGGQGLSTPFSTPSQGENPWVPAEQWNDAHGPARPATGTIWATPGAVTRKVAIWNSPA